MATWTPTTKAASTWLNELSTLWASTNYPWLTSYLPWQEDNVAPHSTTWTSDIDYEFTGDVTPLNDGWVVAPTSTHIIGDVTETITGGVYRTTATGTTETRLNYSDPLSGTHSFDQGIIFEWYAKYLLSSTGTSQVSFWIGDDTRVVRVFIINASITLRTPSVILTDSSTDKTQYHKYKVTINGTTVKYYVDDVLINTVTITDPEGVVTNAIRLEQRCTGGASATLDTYHDWIKIYGGLTNGNRNTTWT